MVIHGQIEKVTKSTLKDKETKAESAMYQVVMSDKTKPAAFRCTTFFTMYLQEEKFRALFGPNDPTDERVTVAVSEMAPKDNFIKVRGQLLVGWLSSEDLHKLQTGGSPAPASAPPRNGSQVPARA